jgi:hypothetical protein
MTPVAATHTLTNLRPGQRPLSAVPSALISTVLMPMLRQQDRARLGRCSKDLRTCDLAVVKGGRALQLKAMIIFANLMERISSDSSVTKLKIVGEEGNALDEGAVDQIIGKYPCVHSFDFDECHMTLRGFRRFSQLLTTDQPPERLLKETKMVQLRLPEIRVRVDAVNGRNEAVAQFLSRLDWSELQCLEYRVLYFVESNHFDGWLSQKLREAKKLWGFHLFPFNHAQNRLIRELPPTVENLEAEVSSADREEAVIESLAARRFAMIDLRAYYYRPISERMFSSLIHSLLRVRVLKLRNINENQIERLGIALSQDAQLEHVSIWTMAGAISISQFLERLLPLASRGALRHIRIDVGHVGFLEATTIFLVRALLAFPDSTDVDVRHPMGQRVSRSETIEKIYRKRRGIFSDPEPDSDLKRAKLDILDHVSKGRIYDDYRELLRQKAIPERVIDQYIATLTPSQLIQTFEELLIASASPAALRLGFGPQPGSKS